MLHDYHSALCTLGTWLSLGSKTTFSVKKCLKTCSEKEKILDCSSSLLVKKLPVSVNRMMTEKGIKNHLFGDYCALFGLDNIGETKDLNKEIVMEKVRLG